ncbi:MAG: branched-chain amino acid ABC transporter permease [Planctomycetota bacterium]|jgi:branched-chain amino acid transport system permease protein|nr:branched-chain amino acid ABC transporter permease [Planctomycetota bacterium]
MSDKTRQALITVGVLLFLALPGMGLGSYWLDVLNQVGLYAVLSLSLNIILGHAGMFHMGHAAFFAVGAYVTAILNTVYHVPVMATLPLAGLAAGVFALLVASPIIHLRGDYLLVVTIGIVEIVRIALINNVFGLTGGSNGIVGIQRPDLPGLGRLTAPWHFFYLIWGFVAISMFMFEYLENSRYGRALKFIREDVVAAEGVGINTASCKLSAFVIGAIWAGFTGTIYATQMRTISPGSFSYWESVVLFMIVILGGRGNQWGVLLGSFLVIGLPELFRGLQSSRMLFFGAALVVMMIFRPQGLIPSRNRRYKLPQPYADKYK